MGLEHQILVRTRQSKFYDPKQAKIDILYWKTGYQDPKKNGGTMTHFTYRFPYITAQAFIIESVVFFSLFLLLTMVIQHLREKTIIPLRKSDLGVLQN